MATYIVQPPFWTKTLLDLWRQYPYRLKLYTNDFTPDRLTDTVAPFTEATATGYAPADVTSVFPAASIDGDGIAYCMGSDVVFTVTADSAVQHVYGWWMEDNLGRLHSSQRGEGSGFPFRFYLAGDTVTVRIRLTQESYGPPPPPAP